MFCGGRRCKYESPNGWKDEDLAIEGVYSHWITDDLLAMARPNATLIAKHKIVEQFQHLGVKSIINLQTPGEHASCGPRLHESGFTYDPADFMKADIFFYNFAWKDYGEASMPGLLDMVKVLSFALSEGKVAVHCHAGLGRTGVLAAAYLVYYLRVRSNDALRFVRLKRPGAVQTRRQIECVKEFEAYFLPQCLMFSLKPAGDPDRKQGRFSIEHALKRQKYVVHGFEARALKYIPKIVFKICERLLRLCNCGPAYSADLANFTKMFISYKFDAKGGKMAMGNFGSSSSNNTNHTTPSDSIMATRRSSQSLILTSDDDTLAASTSTSTLNSLSSSGMPTPRSGTRPGSETSSYIQSCSSALSGVDDRRLDELLGDGIHNQTIQENMVTKELASQMDLQRVAASEHLPVYGVASIYDALMAPYDDILRRNEDKADKYRAYKNDLNNRASTWNRLDTELDLHILCGLLFEWLEHLKGPILDRDGITFVVIHCDNVEAAVNRLPNHVSYILEYLVRFVHRLNPLTREQVELVMTRLVASLTHQSVTINDVTYPNAKNKFPKLRGGTADSTLKFLLKLKDVMETQEENERKRVSGSANNLANNLRLQQMAAADNNNDDDMK